MGAILQNLRSAIAAAAALLSVTIGAGVHAEDKPPIKVGAILPMTGFASTYGTLFRTGIVMAVEDVNAAGGINGSKIDLLVEDDQLAATQSVLLFRKLAAEGVTAVLGPVTSTSWENVIPLANALQVPAINYTSLKPGLSGRPYAIRLHPTDDTMIPEGMAEFLRKFPDVQKVVVAGDMKEAAGAAGVEEFRKAAAARGLEVLDVIGYETRTSDFSPVVLKLRGDDPDAVFVSSLVPTTLQLVKEMEAQGMTKPILSTATVWAGSFVQAAGSAGRTVFTIGFNSNEPAPEVKGHDAFVARFLKLTSETTQLPQPANVSQTTLGYDAVMLLAGILRTRGIDGRAELPAQRQALADGMGEIKRWQGLNTLVLRDTGDFHIQSHLLAADVPGRIWRYALPPEQRIAGASQ